MEPLDLEPIKARLAAATPAPWVWVDYGGAPEDALSIYTLEGVKRDWGGRFAIEARPPEDEEGQEPDEYEVVYVLHYIEDEHDDMYYEIPIEDADAALSVNAPTDLAALVAEVERLRAQLGESI
jgi:hypothetical protein